MARGRQRGLTAYMGLKACGVCKRTLPLPKFHLDKNRADGREHRCRDCRLFLRNLDKTSKRLGYTREEQLLVAKCAREAIAVQQWEPEDQEAPSS